MIYTFRLIKTIYLHILNNYFRILGELILLYLVFILNIIDLILRPQGFLCMIFSYRSLISLKILMLMFHLIF